MGGSPVVLLPSVVSVPVTVEVVEPSVVSAVPLLVVGGTRVPPVVEGPVVPASVSTKSGLSSRMQPPASVAIARRQPQPTSHLIDST